jgi:transcriptional regulator with XRE-family HTH domain
MSDPSTAREPGARPDYPQMGERLRAARTARGLSLRVLASRLGVSPSLISQIETGRANPSVSTLYAIAAELDVSLDELLFNDRRPPEAPEPPGPPTETVAAPTPIARARARGGLLTQAAPEPVQSAATRHQIRLASGVIWDRLTTTSEPGVEFLQKPFALAALARRIREILGAGDGQNLRLPFDS